jgi:putative ABC transport system ATP-binding protein
MDALSNRRAMDDDWDVQQAGGVEIWVDGLSHAYDSPNGRLCVLSGVELHIPAGSFCVLSGPSGVGKTTLLTLLGGLQRPQEGTVRVGDSDVGQLVGDGLAAYRRTRVGFVFQHFGLLDALTARENVELAMSLAGVSRRERHARAGELLDAVGLRDRADHRPAQLSGGERQRVAMARALANRPRMLLADEPAGNLDDQTSKLVIDRLVRLHEERRFTLVIVTHDRSIGERAPLRFRLERGRVLAA